MKTEVVLNESEKAWDISIEELGRTVKLASCSYVGVHDDEISSTILKYRALRRALFISACFNGADESEYLKP